MEARPRDLELDEDPSFQRRQQLVQRIGLGLMAAVVLAALLGLLGAGGPLSEADVRGDALSIRYTRFARRLSPTTLELRVQPSAVRDGEASIWISSDYLDALKVERVAPLPRTVVAGGERTTFVFDASPGGTKPLSLSFELNPQDSLQHHGRAGLTGGAELSFSTFVYP